MKSPSDWSWCTVAVLTAVCGARAQEPARQEPVAYALLSRQGEQVVGTVSVQPTGSGASLHVSSLGGSQLPVLEEDPARSRPGRRVFVPPPRETPRPARPQVGFNGTLGGEEPAPLPLRAAQEEPSGTTVTLFERELVLEVRRGQELVRRERLRRWRAVLIVHGHGRPFDGYARDLASLYRQRGLHAQVLDGSLGLDAFVSQLEEAGRTGARFERAVFISHGGWDGPMIGPQRAQGSPEFQQLARAIAAGTTPQARIFVSACHAAGSNVHELADGWRKDRWTVGLARAAGRVVAGPAGPTSTDYTRRHVLAVLEGQGTTAQEVWVASSEGVKTIRPGGTLASARSAPHAPEQVPPRDPGPGTSPADTAADDEQAVSELSALIRREPSNAGAYLARAHRQLSLARAGRPTLEAAVSDFQTAYELDLQAGDQVEALIKLEIMIDALRPVDHGLARAATQWAIETSDRLRSSARR